MNKLSVVIPTIYKKPSVLYKSIEQLSKEDIIDEIIVISNAPCPMQFPQTPKLIALEPERNAYVNMSWNIGLHNAKNDNFLLLNDDILLPPNYCQRVVESDVFNDETTGLIGLHPNSVVLYNKNEVEDIEIPVEDEHKELIITPIERYEKTGDWGSAIFGKIKNYYYIPKIFQIIFGDNYLLYRNLANNKINYQVSGVKFNHIHSSSAASKEFSDIIDSDYAAWYYFKENYINKKNNEENN